MKATDIAVTSRSVNSFVIAYDGSQLVEISVSFEARSFEARGPSDQADRDDFFRVQRITRVYALCRAFLSRRHDLLESSGPGIADDSLVLIVVYKYQGINLPAIVTGCAT